MECVWHAGIDRHVHNHLEQLVHSNAAYIFRSGAPSSIKSTTGVRQPAGGSGVGVVLCRPVGCWGPRFLTA